MWNSRPLVFSLLGCSRNPTNSVNKLFDEVSKYKTNYFSILLHHNIVMIMLRSCNMMDQSDGFFNHTQGMYKYNKYNLRLNVLEALRKLGCHLNELKLRDVPNYSANDKTSFLKPRTRDEKFVEDI